MAKVALTRSKKPIAESFSIHAYYSPGKATAPEHYGFRIPSRAQPDRSVYVELSEFELRNIMAEWQRLAQSFYEEGQAPFVSTLPKVEPL